MPAHLPPLLVILPDRKGLGSEISAYFFLKRFLKVFSHLKMLGQRLLAMLFWLLKSMQWCGFPPK